MKLTITYFAEAFMHMLCIFQNNRFFLKLTNTMERPISALKPTLHDFIYISILNVHEHPS